MPTSATTTTRLTAHPWAASNDPNERSHDENTEGWDTWLIWATMAVSVPGVAPGWAWPDHDPRPGQAWRTPIPMKKTPIPRSTHRPRSGLSQAESRSATSTPATT